MTYPADASDTGYQNAPGYPGSLTAWPGGTFQDSTAYSFYDFSSAGTAIDDADFASGTSAVNVTFTGCRFASNAVSDACVYTVGTGITYRYCTFEPSTVPAGSEPAISDTSYQIAHGSGYQYGIIQNNNGPVTVDHCRFWGFANAIQIGASAQDAPFQVTYSLFQNPRADGGVDHTDGPGILDNTVTASYLVIDHCTILGTGNTNAIALQGGVSFDHFQITGNYVSGFGYTCFLGTVGYPGQSTTNETFSGNTFGSDIKPGGGPVYEEYLPFGTDAAHGNIWAGNKYHVLAGSAWMAAGNDGLYWWPGDGNPATSSSIVGHPGDYVNILIASDLAGITGGESGYVYTFPDGAPAAGNLDVLCVSVWGGSAATPPGWTAGAFNANPDELNMYFFSLLAGSDAGSTVTITTSGSNVGQIGWSRFTGLSGTADAHGFAQQATGGPVTTPAVSTGTLAKTGELSVAFAAMINGSAGPSSVSWSSGYTGMQAASFDGNSIAAITGYNPAAGTAAETPNVSWTPAYTYAAILVQTFTAAAPAGEKHPRASLPSLYTATL